MSARAVRALLTLSLGAGVLWTPPARAQAAPRLRIVPIAAFDSMPFQLAQPGAWSPRGTRLALLRGQNQLWVLDASEPEHRPWQVYDAREWIRGYGWSPDGEWLLLIVGDASARNDRRLVAVSLDGRPDTLRSEPDIIEAFWGSDGRIHERVDTAWREGPPPARWKPTSRFASRPVPAVSGVGLALSLGANPGGSHPPVHLGMCMDDTRSIWIPDALPDGSRLIVGIAEDTTSALRLVNGRGEPLLDLRRAGPRIEPTAIDGDTGMIVGFSGEGGGGEQGWTRTWLEAVEARGRWSAKITGGEGGSSPQMSREGSFIAWRTAVGTSVGQVVVEPR